jgi:23S rRNA pseudouridine1911/1915/1917 synthase
MEKELGIYVTGEKPGRLDAYAAEKSRLSREMTQKLIEQGLVTLNGAKTKPSSKLKEGDIINIRIPMPKDAGIEEQDIPLDILFEDEHIAVINKKRGMVVHPSVGHAKDTVVNALIYHLDDLSGIGGEERPGIVHRLDKNTSGLMIVAKTDEAHRKLTTIFQSRKITKEYVAIVHGRLRGREGVINLPIGRDTNDRKLMAISVGGKNAVTRWKVKKSYDEYSVVSLFLETGRTHQIRVHLKQVGNPVVGDPEYGKTEKVPFKIDGQALHAFRLSFDHPITGNNLEFEAPMPEDMQGIIEELDRRNMGITG